MKKSVIKLHNFRKIDDTVYQAAYPETKKENNFYYHGLVLHNTHTYNLKEYPYIKLAVEATEKTKLKVVLDLVQNRSPKPEFHRYVEKTLVVSQKGKQDICLRADQFSLPVSQQSFLRFVRGIKVETNKDIVIRSISLQKGESFAVESPILSKTASPGEKISFLLRLYNCTEESQTFTFQKENYGWETLEIRDLPEWLEVGPLEVSEIEIHVPINDKLCSGGYEQIVIQITGEHARQQKIVFEAGSALPHPSVLMDGEEFSRVQRKISRCVWAEQLFQDWKKRVREWTIPEIDVKKPYLFVTRHSEQARIAGCVYQLSGMEEAAQKVIAFLRRLSDPEIGYLRLPRACSQELVQEGGFFRDTAMAYDMVYDHPDLTAEDHTRIQTVFYAAMKVFADLMETGNISNWNLLELTGGICCAAVLQDLERIRHFLYSVGGVTDQLAAGTMADGFWFEASVGYNLLCAQLFAEITQVVKHFGIDLIGLQVNARYSPHVNSISQMQDGLVAESWGANDKTYRTPTMLWDSLLPFFDYRGVIFGINDSMETMIEGNNRFDLAYYVYRKQEYAEALKKVPDHMRDLLFGEENLPSQETAPLYCISSYADNAGVAVLRSQCKERTDREQIQVGIKYGSHGGAHGHYDRLSMTSLMRYGRSLYAPQNVWYSYHTFMYKFYVQTSLTHNMVVVDLKQQDPTESKRFLFYPGKMMQALGVENCSRWSYPPYGGWQVDGDKSFAERTWREGRYVPIPEKIPEYSIRTGFTEPILSRRLTVVTDDFVVNFDYIAGEQEHCYDCMYHFQGLDKIEGKDVVHLGHREQLDTDPFGSAQFITDCEEYRLERGARIRFSYEYTEKDRKRAAWMTRNRTSYNDPGMLKTDVYLAWPRQAEVLIGHPPEYEGVNKQLWYSVETDGNTAAQGKFGAWILGREEIDISVEGVKELVLKTKIRVPTFEGGIVKNPNVKSIFWGNPTLELADGSRIDVQDLSMYTDGIDWGKGPGADYAGGPVKIQGICYDKAIPGEPLLEETEGTIRIPLDGIPAVRFTACIGSDYPVGEEETRRCTVAYRKRAIVNTFITVIEPVEDQHLIESVFADSENSVMVTMKDGRIVVIKISDLSQKYDVESKYPQIQIEEWKDGHKIRAEYSGKDEGYEKKKEQMLEKGSCIGGVDSNAFFHDDVYGMRKASSR